MTPFDCINSQCGATDGDCGCVANLRAEIERLREVVKFDGAEKERLWAIGKARDAEIERLRAELDKAHRLCGQFIGWQRDLYIANAKLSQQVERLQAAAHNAFMAMCAFRDGGDEECFQDAIDALGFACGKSGCDDKSVEKPNEIK